MNVIAHIRQKDGDYSSDDQVKVAITKAKDNPNLCWMDITIRGELTSNTITIMTTPAKMIGLECLINHAMYDCFADQVDDSQNGEQPLPDPKPGEPAAGFRLTKCFADQVDDSQNGEQPLPDPKPGEPADGFRLRSRNGK